MNKPEPVSGERSNTARYRRFERVCDEFEAHLKAGSSPRIEDYLTTAPSSDRRDLLAQLLALELSYLADRGERPLAGVYQARFAEHSDTVAAAFDKIELLAAPDGGQLATTNLHRPTIQPGAVVAGRYKVLQPLGEGGMGTVYLAEQEQPVKRRVALKLIKPGMDSAQVLRRFEAERQALALMDHTNIARVFDAGTTSEGRPYFVMELVKGVPITKYCDELHLSLQDRLQLFVPVCQAIQHAHQKGIIHRDIKPSNVLVAMQDGKPVPKVIDFGVAKALYQKLTEGSMYTEIGQIVGTLEYMSPEQAELSALDIDTRTDVYALGVLLYELLTGSTPLDRKRLKQAAYVEMLRIIREVEPPKPSTRLSESKESLAGLAAQRRTEPARLTKAMRGELDWIVMKALEKDRTRRYETANGLARDVERHLNDEPVEACPPSASYRAGKFFRRHKGPVLAAALVLLTLVGGIVGTTWGLVRAENSFQAEAKQRSIAEKKEQEASAAAERESRAKEREAEQRRLAEERKELAEGNEKQAIAKKQIADAVLAFLQRDLLRQADASEQADAARRLGGAFEPTENPTINELLDRAAVELAPEKIESKFPGQREVQASILATIGETYRRTGEYDKAVEILERASDVCRSTFGRDDEQTLANLNDLALAYQDAGRLREAVALHEQVREARVAKFGSDHPVTLITMNNLALAYQDAGRLPEAIELLEQLRDVRVKSFGADHPDSHTPLNNLAGVYQDAGRLPEAIELLEQVRDAELKQLGADHPDTLSTLHSLATAYLAAGRLPQAIELFLRVRDAIVKLLGADHPHTLATLSGLAAAYWEANQLDESVPLFEDLLKRWEAKLGRHHPHTQLTVANLGVNYKDAGRVREAIPLLEEAYAASRELPALRFVGGKLMDAYLKAGKSAEAAELIPEQLAEVRKTLPQGSPQLANSLAQFGLTLITAKSWIDAEPLVRECLEIREKLQPEAWTTFNTKSLLGATLLGQNKYAEAEPLLVAGYEGLKKNEATIPPQAKVRLTEALQRLVDFYTATGQQERADMWRTKLEAAQPKEPAIKP